MRILVTGGAGFIGSCMIRYLLNNTDHIVINLDKLTYAGNLDSLVDIQDSTNYYFECMDICNFEDVKKVFAQYSPDIVMHFAAESHVDRSIESPLEFLNTNIIGTYNLLQAGKIFFESIDRESQTRFKFLHISTDEVFGDLDDPSLYFTETSHYAPSSPYSASKASADHLVRAWGRTYNLPILISNCSNNYGPFHFPEKLIPQTIINAMQGKSIPIYGNGQQVRDWLFVEDHIKALYLIATEGKIGNSYNIGGHNEKKNIEVVESICHILDTIVISKPNNIDSFAELIEFVDDRPGHDQRYAIDASKIKSELGWMPEESFKSGLMKTVQWYVNNPIWWGRVLSGEYQTNKL
jgi:dTDP-glucose 4,6-dehydratase